MSLTEISHEARDAAGAGKTRAAQGGECGAQAALDAR